VAQNQVDTLRSDASGLALIAGRKLAHVAVSQMPHGEVEEALREALHQAITEPRIVLRAAPEVVSEIKDKLEDLAMESGFEGRLVATADPAIRGADCRIEWRGGGAERSMQQLEEAIGEVVSRRLSQASHSQVRTSTKG